MNAATTRQQGSVGKEHEALSRLIVRLKGQFPYLPSGHIEGLVHSHHAEFNDRPVREFVPIFVERAVRATLEDQTRDT